MFFLEFQLKGFNLEGSFLFDSTDVRAAAVALTVAATVVVTVADLVADMVAATTQENPKKRWQQQNETVRREGPVRLQHFLVHLFIHFVMFVFLANAMEFCIDSMFVLAGLACFQYQNSCAAQRFGWNYMIFGPFFPFGKAQMFFDYQKQVIRRGGRKSCLVIKHNLYNCLVWLAAGMRQIIQSMSNVIFVALNLGWCPLVSCMASKRCQPKLRRATCPWLEILLTERRLRTTKLTEQVQEFTDRVMLSLQAKSTWGNLEGASFSVCPTFRWTTSTHSLLLAMKEAILHIVI